MRQDGRLSSVLASRGFRLHESVGARFGLGFTGQSAILAASSAVAFLACGLVEQSLWLGGGDVGLLEHPAIWTFLLLQFVLPLAIRRSLVVPLRHRSRLKRILPTGWTFQADYIDAVLRFVRLETPPSRAVASLFITCGLIAFGWNTLQNQRPRVAVPFEFWDSSSFQLVDCIS